MPQLIKKRSRVALAILCAAAAGAAAAGQSQRSSQARKPAGTVPVAKVTPPPGVAGSKSSGQSEAHFTGEDLTYDSSNGVLRGRNMRFHFPEEDRTVFGESGSYNDHSKIIEAQGHILIEDPKHRVTGDKARVDNGKQKLAIITGSVIVVLKPDPQTASPADKDQAGSARQHGATITCDRLDDYFHKNYIIMRGHFVGKQNFRDKDGKEIERTLTAEHAEYDGKKENLELFPPVDVHDNQGQQIHFDSIVNVGTRQGAETIQSSGPFHGTAPYDTSSEDEGPVPGPPPPKEGKPGGASPPPGKP
ncbi:MAG TPA: hypothetical protein VKT32_09845 [Chthonomonadaceae bacterium]|nr:hypothetical protein [Chthonomonadaceae bacterium]